MDKLHFISKIILLQLLALLVVDAQIIPTQNNSYFPQFDSTTKSEILANTFLNTEFLFSNGSYQGDKDRIYRLMGDLEIYKNENSVVNLYLANELNCNTKNDLGFNPRQVIWEENLSYFRKINSYIVNFTLFHRCKHEIDNSDSPVGDSTSANYIPTKRVVVLNGINLGVTTKYELINSLNLKINLNTDLYKTSEDYRTPQENGNLKPDWTDLSSTIRTNFRFTYSLTETIAVYSRFNFNLMLFLNNKQNYYKNNYAIEFGANYSGKTEAIEAFVFKESLFDELAFITPHPTNYFGFGIRLRGNSFF